MCNVLFLHLKYGFPMAIPICSANEIKWKLKNKLRHGGELTLWNHSIDETDHFTVGKLHIGDRSMMLKGHLIFNSDQRKFNKEHSILGVIQTYLFY